MPERRLLLWTYVEGDTEPRWTTHSMALLTGMPDAEVESFAANGFGFDDAPDHWRRASARRWKEAEAHGALPNNPFAVIGYWGEQRGGTVEVGSDDGNHYGVLVLP